VVRRRRGVVVRAAGSVYKVVSGVLGACSRQRRGDGRGWVVVTNVENAVLRAVGGSGATTRMATVGECAEGARVREGERRMAGLAAVVHDFAVTYCAAGALSLLQASSSLIIRDPEQWPLRCLEQAKPALAGSGPSEPPTATCSLAERRAFTAVWPFYYLFTPSLSTPSFFRRPLLPLLSSSAYIFGGRLPLRVVLLCRLAPYLASFHSRLDPEAVVLISLHQIPGTAITKKIKKAPAEWNAAPAALPPPSLLPLCSRAALPPAARAEIDPPLRARKGIAPA
jgi:hypothetical protein